MPFVSSVRGTFGPQSENRGVKNSTGLAEFFRQSPSGVSGGTITTAGGYRIHTFTTVGNSTFNLGSSSGDVEYLVVAGGGAAAPLSGGGGAGGYRSGSLSISGPQPVTVGDGGVAFSPYTMDPPASAKGQNSVFGAITSTGGGAGAKYNAAIPSTGTPSYGGSGGGGGNVGGGGGGGASAAGQSATSGVAQSQSTPFADGIPGQGNPGGIGYHGYPYPLAKSGNGGAGSTSSISGISTTYAGGGGGGGHPVNGSHIGASLPSPGPRDAVGGVGGGGIG
jgi:hypothetical protein